MNDLLPSQMLRPDIEAVVGVHLQSFPDFFLTFLGRRFLCELYRGIVDDETGIALVYRSDKSIVGFVAGTTQAHSFYRRLLRQRWWRFAVASISPTLRNPLIVPRILRAFGKSRAPECQSEAATIMSMAVAPEHQRHGIGASLVKAFLEEAARRDVSAVNLTTDAVDNEPVRCFYARLGFSPVARFTTPEGRTMDLIEVRFDAEAEASPSAPEEPLA